MFLRVMWLYWDVKDGDHVIRTLTHIINLTILAGKTEFLTRIC